MQIETAPIKLTNQRYRLGYHVAAKAGWINDPNGFVFFKGYYHIFYQHHPYSAEWGPMHWGHARSKDLVHWETLPIALTPGDVEDADGCFSGSAVVKDDKLYLIYTGHHYYPGDDDPEHFWQNQNLAFSEDGVHFTKYAHNPIIAAAPTDNTQHFRDPKVWYQNGDWYLILGSQCQTNGLGRVLTYRSHDLIDWTYLGPITQSHDRQTEGYMWECPDFFRLGDQDVLLMSPQGITPKGYRFRNQNETGYLLGHFSYAANKFERGDFQELDHGHDFYATQTTLVPDGRRLVMGWMDMWGSQMPEQADGWAGALTFPRELTLKHDRLLMNPVAELEQLRLGAADAAMVTVDGAKTVTPNGNHFEALINFDQANASGIELVTAAGQTLLQVRYEQAKHQVVLKRPGDDGTRVAVIPATEQLKYHLLVDTSSAELFVNDGEATFTERLYPTTDLTLKLLSQGDVQYQIYQLATDAIKY